MHGALLRCFCTGRLVHTFLTEDAEAVNRLSLSDVMADGPDLNGNGVRFPATGHPERFALTLYDAPAKLNSATRPPHDGTTGAPFRSANSPRGRTAAIGTAHDAGTTTGRAYTPSPRGRTAAVRTTHSGSAATWGIIAVPLPVPWLAGIVVVPIGLVKRNNSQADRRNECR